jgi:tubulin polyglutamylase TTLL5
MPQTFILPHEYNKFVAAFYAHQSGQNDKADAKDKEPNLWILKPVGLSRGRGISLVSDLSDVKYDMQTVVQSCELLLCLDGTHLCLF